MYAQKWALPVCPATCSCHSARVRVWRNLRYQEVEAYWWVGLDNMQFLCQSVPPNFLGKQLAFLRPSYHIQIRTPESTCYAEWSLKGPKSNEAIFHAVGILVSFSSDYAPRLEHCASTASLIPDIPQLAHSQLRYQLCNVSFSSFTMQMWSLINNTLSFCSVCIHMMRKHHLWMMFTLCINPAMTST